MPTILEVAKQVVEGAIDLSEYDEQTIGDVFMLEYSHHGFSQVTCCEWLRGLPAACTIPFSDYEILKLLSEHGIVRKSDRTKGTLIDEYWCACGYALFQLIKSGK